MILSPAALSLLAPIVRLAVVEALQEIGNSNAVTRTEFNAAAAKAEAAAMRKFRALLEESFNVSTPDEKQ